MNLRRWIALLALTGIASPAFAQAKNCGYYSCSEEEEKKWVQERQEAENDAALKALRARLLASPHCHWSAIPCWGVGESPPAPGQPVGMTCHS